MPTHDLATKHSFHFMLARDSSRDLRSRSKRIELRTGVSEHQFPDRGRRPVVFVQARAGADERCPGGVILLEERRRRRDEREVELDEGLFVEVRERLLEEVDPTARCE